MDCDKATALVEKLVDGEASPQEARDAEAHLASCASCRDHLAFLRAVSRNAGGSDLEPPPDSYWEHLPRKILERIESDRAPRQRGFFPALFSPVAFRLAALAATVVLVVAVGVNVLRDDSLTVATPQPERVAPAPEVSESPEPSQAQPAEPRERAASPSMAPQAKVQAEALEDAPAPAAEERAFSEQADSLRALGYVAGADEPPPEAQPPPQPAVPAAPAASVTAIAPTEGLPSNFAEVAGEPGDARSERPLARERASRSQASRNEPELSGGRAELRIAVDECEDLRKVLTTTGEEGTRAADVRYELARCSLAKLVALEGLEGEETDGARATAIADAEAFLALETEGPRAEEIREEVRKLREPR